MESNLGEGSPNQPSESDLRRSQQRRGGSENNKKNSILRRCFRFVLRSFGYGVELKIREFKLGHPPITKFPPNVIKNQKYNILTFIPYVLFQQFKFFLNLYFLIMAGSQFFKDVQIGYWYTYWGPLIFVITVTMIREAVDDIRRKQRDREINSQKYQRISSKGESVFIPSSCIRVGDLIVVEKDQRVPADMILLRTSDKNGRCFIRTDQLDGETDWKLRQPILQEDVSSDRELLNLNVLIYAERPQKDIHSFIGTLTKRDDDEGGSEESGISVENTLWANTVISAGNAVGVVIYTGRETRSVMNNSIPRSKVGLIDLEINDLTKILFVAVVGLAFLMMCLKGFEGPWPRYMFRFVLLFSYIIPISLRVNMDMAKASYSFRIQRDETIRGTVVRSTTIPEDLGRISYLLTDKTGTLTQNEMVFRRLHLESSTFDSPDEVTPHLSEGLMQRNNETGLVRRTTGTRVTEAVKALAICHNVTPVYEGGEDAEMEVGMGRQVTLQASSPDEIALVKWAGECGLSLLRRDGSSMVLSASLSAGASTLSYTILHTFPFTSDLKRMGVIVRENISPPLHSGPNLLHPSSSGLEAPPTHQNSLYPTVGQSSTPPGDKGPGGTRSGKVIFYLKGADGVMKGVVRNNYWLDEAVGNMSREGLRTLVVAKKELGEEEYEEWRKRYEAATASKKANRTQLMTSEMMSLEKDMELVAVTGVEDTLQPDVKETLEALRNAGIKIWMLTGDKLETAVCIAKSSKLVSSTQEVFIFEEKPTGSDITDRAWTFSQLNNYRRKTECPLIIRGESLEVCLESYEKEFMELACGSPAVVVCRCSPTQKAQVVSLVQKMTGKRTAAIGDGGNDVAMIQAADAGIGIEGKEGRQASLAADFSITQFSFIAPLLLIHGRYSYKRSASLAQFVMHRGLIITVMQAIFSSIFYFSSVALYQGFLMIGYATLYTMLPVFALVLDKDVKESDLLRLPELYSELGKGRSLTYKTFFLWVLISVLQGGVIMYSSLILFHDEFIHIVSISFSSLILTELIMVALTIRTMHTLMILAEFVSLIFYFATIAVAHQYFDINFILSVGFLWKVVLITTLSCLPIYVGKFVRKCISPPTYSKL